MKCICLLPPAAFGMIRIVLKLQLWSQTVRRRLRSYPVPLPFPPQLYILSCAPKSNQIERRKWVSAAATLPDEPWRLGGHLLPVRPAGGSGAAIIQSDKGRFRGGNGVARVHIRKESDDGLVIKHSASPFSDSLLGVVAESKEGITNLSEGHQDHWLDTCSICIYI